MKKMKYKSTSIFNLIRSLLVYESSKVINIGRSVWSYIIHAPSGAVFGKSIFLIYGHVGKGHIADYFVYIVKC